MNANNHHNDTPLTAAQSVPTYKNTKFADWWQMLNAELAKVGKTEMTFGPAKDAYDVGESPTTAAHYDANK